MKSVGDNIGNGSGSNHRTFRLLACCSVLLFVSVGLALAQSPQQKAWQILEAGISEKSTDKRAAAAGVLGLIPKDAKAAGMAEKALEDEKPEVRKAAASALGRMEARSSIAKLKKALGDKEASVAMAAAQSLLSFGDPEGYDLYYAVLTGERKTGSGMVDEQLKTFKDPKKMATFGLEEGIGFVPFAGIGYGAFKALTKDDASPVRAAAAKVLVKDPDPRTGQGLLRAASDKRWLVRAAALDAIAMRGDSSLLAGIEPKMSDQRATVRYTAAAAVIRLASLRVAGRARK
jgi:HEAT repeat protein